MRLQHMKLQHKRLQHKGTGARVAVALALFDLQFLRLLFLIAEIGVQVVWWQFR